MAQATRPGGQQAKICQFKLVLLGKKLLKYFSLSQSHTALARPSHEVSLHLILGESAVGKSSLVLRFVKGQFHEFQEVRHEKTMLLLS